MQSIEIALGVFNRNTNRFLLFVTFVTEFLLLNLLSWPNVSHWGLRGTYFMDMNATVNFVECYKKFGLDIYGHVPEASCSNYVYGTLVILMLYLFSSTAWIVGVLSFASLLLVSGAISFFVSQVNSKLIYKIILGSILVFSPPISLLVERGNIDSFILGLLLFSLTLCCLRPSNFWGFLLLALTCLIKFYTLPLFVLIFFLQKRYLKRSQTVLFLFTTILTLNDFSRIQSLPTKSPYASFGITLFGDYATQLFSSTTQVRLLGVLSGCIVYILAIVILSLRLRGRFELPHVPEHKLRVFLSLTFFLVFICCYFAGRNYDYRLLILIVSIYLIIPSCTLNIRRFLAAGSLVVLYLSYNVNAVLQAFGEFSLLLLISFISALFLTSKMTLKEFLV